MGNGHLTKASTTPNPVSSVHLKQACRLFTYFFLLLFSPCCCQWYTPHIFYDEHWSLISFRCVCRLCTAQCIHNHQHQHPILSELIKQILLQQQQLLPPPIIITMSRHLQPIAQTKAFIHSYHPSRQQLSIQCLQQQLTLRICLNLMVEALACLTTIIHIMMTWIHVDPFPLPAPTQLQAWVVMVHGCIQHHINSYRLFLKIAFRHLHHLHTSCHIMDNQHPHHHVKKRAQAAAALLHIPSDIVPHRPRISTWKRTPRASHPIHMPLSSNMQSKIAHKRNLLWVKFTSGWLNTILTIAQLALVGRCVNNVLCQTHISVTYPFYFRTLSATIFR